MIYVYHYYATCYNAAGTSAIHLDGVLERNKLVQCSEDYKEVRKQLLKELKRPNTSDEYSITIKTLYLLGEHL